MKKLKFPVFIPLIISLINAAGTALYLGSVEAETIPTHYDLYMNPDRYGSKWEMLLFCGIILLLSVAFIIYRATAGKRVGNRKNIRYEDPFISIIVLFFCAINWFLMLTATGATTPDRSWLPWLTIILGILLLLYGNISGKLKQNRNFGIKFKSTLHNRTVWKKAHRLSGVLSCIGGVIMIACGICGIFIDRSQQVLFAASFILAMVIAFFIPTVYAASLYKKLGDDGSYAELLSKTDEAETETYETEEK